MKALYTFVICILTFGLNAQTAPDFTVTDTHGNELSLYEDFLDQGKTVVLDLFFVDCGPCNGLAPFLEPLYQEWGAGSGDVEFISLTSEIGDNDAKVIGFEELHGTTWPAISSEGGGIEAHDPYTTGDFGQFVGYPTLIVIAPDKSVQFDAWGNSYEQTIEVLDSWISNTGAQKPLVGISDLSNVAAFSFSPNPVSETANLVIDLKESAVLNAQIFNSFGQPVLNLFSGKINEGLQSIELNSADLPSGTYFLRMSMNDQINACANVNN